jgi:hypothetical protein
MSWDSVFEGVYSGYAPMLQGRSTRQPNAALNP